VVLQYLVWAFGKGQAITQIVFWLYDILRFDYAAVINTSTAGSLVAAHWRTTGARYICDQCTIYSYFTSNANHWLPGHMFSSIKYKHFVQVSSKQKHTFIMWFDVQCGQEIILKQQRSFAYSHGGQWMRFTEVWNKEVRCNYVTDHLFTLHLIESSFKGNVDKQLLRHFLTELKHMMYRLDDFSWSINAFSLA